MAVKTVAFLAARQEYAIGVPARHDEVEEGRWQRRNAGQPERRHPRPLQAREVGARRGVLI